MRKKRRKSEKGAKPPVGGWLGEDLLFFIETAEFTEAWKDLDLGDEGDLTALQLTIMSNPRQAPVISGTGGLRKLRFAPPSWKRGK